MLIEAARRAEAAVKEMMAIANDGSATADEFRDALGISKSIVGISSAFQTSAAATVAGRERHGDGGAEVLAEAALFAPTLRTPSASPDVTPFNLPQGVR